MTGPVLSGSVANLAPMPRIGSLFSGYGGLELGVQSVLGGTTAWVSDVDRGACKILAHRYPDVPNLGDITAVDWTQVEPVDVLTGGFPCQDVSHAGKRAGLKPDTRSGLWSHMAYAIDTLRPRLVVAENVRGLLSAPAVSEGSNREPCVCGRPDRRRGMGEPGNEEGLLPGSRHGRDDTAGQADAVGAAAEIRRQRQSVEAGNGSLGRGVDLERLRRGGGRDAFADQAASSDQGAAGGSGDGGRAAAAGTAEASEWLRGMELGHAHSLFADQGRVASAQPEGPETCATCGGLTGSPDGDMEPCPLCVGDEPGGALRALGAVLGDLADLGYDARWVGLRAADVGAPHGRFRVFVVAWPADTDGVGHEQGRGARGRGTGPTDGGVAAADTSGDRRHERRAESEGLVGRPDAAIGGASTRFGQYAPAVARWGAVLGRPAPAPAIDGRLNPAFVEWMMGLPAGHVTDVPGLTRNEQLKALGNGVPPQQAAAALRIALGNLTSLPVSEAVA